MRIAIPLAGRRRVILTPLIDVLFLLVMFFLLSSTFADLRRLDVTVGATTGGNPAPDAPTPLFLVIAAGVGGQAITATIDGVAVPFEGLRDVLEQRARSGVTEVLLQMRRGTSVQDLVTGLDLLRRAGLDRVRVISR